MNKINITGWPLPKSKVLTSISKEYISPRSLIKKNPHVMPPSIYSTFIGKHIYRITSYEKFYKALDMGSGSGFLSALLCETGIPNIVAADIVNEALDSTKALIKDLGFTTAIKYIRSNIWGSLENEKFDFIVCNPPSLPCREGHIESIEKYWYDGGPKGRDFINTFVTGLANHLNQNGIAILAHTSLADLWHTIEECKKSHLAITSDDYIDFPFRDFYFDIIPEDLFKSGDSTLFYKYGGQYFERVWLLSIKLEK